MLSKCSWDTEKLGIHVGKLDYTSSLGRAELTKIAPDLEEYDLIYLYSDLYLGDQVTIGDYSGQEWGGRTCLELKNIERGHKSRASTKDWNLIKLEELSTMAEEVLVMSGENSRFNIDPDMPRSFMPMMYKEWGWGVLQDPDGEVIAALEPEGGINGICCIKHSKFESNIELIAVRESSRGRGLGQLLISSAIQGAARKRSRRITVTTQRTNSAALALYKMSGFDVIDERYIYHLRKAS